MCVNTRDLNSFVLPLISILTLMVLRLITPSPEISLRLPHNDYSNTVMMAFICTPPWVMWKLSSRLYNIKPSRRDSKRASNNIHLSLDFWTKLLRTQLFGFNKNIYILRINHSQITSHPSRNSLCSLGAGP